MAESQLSGAEHEFKSSSVRLSGWLLAGSGCVEGLGLGSRLENRFRGSAASPAARLVNPDTCSSGLLAGLLLA